MLSVWIGSCRGSWDLVYWIVVFHIIHKSILGMATIFMAHLTKEHGCPIASSCPFESVDVTFSRGETHGLRGLTSQDGANSFAPFAKEIYEGGRGARRIQRQNICSWSWLSNRNLVLIQLLLSYCIHYISGGHVHVRF